MSSPAVSTGVSLQNILLPTDFSSCSELAFLYASSLCRRYGSTLCTVTVVPEEITDYVQPPDPFYLRHSAEKKMAELAGSEQLQGIKHRQLVREGFVSETLLTLIDRLGIDLVVLGTHGRGGVKKLVLGSVAEEIVESARCPVLTVGPKVLPKADVKLQRILCAIDLLHGSATELTYALWLTEQEHAHLTLLHVLKPPSHVPPEYAESEKNMTTKRLRQLLPPETSADMEPEFAVEIGTPGEHILKVAERQNADLIVIGPHHTAFARASTHLPWATPHQVLCHARCPVLTVQN